MSLNFNLIKNWNKRLDFGAFQVYITTFCYNVIFAPD